MGKTLRNIFLSVAALGLPGAVIAKDFGYPYPMPDANAPTYSELGGLSADQAEYNRYKSVRASVVFADRNADDGRENIYLCKVTTPPINIDFSQAITMKLEKTDYDKGFFFIDLRERYYDPTSIEYKLQDYFKNCVKRTDLPGMKRLQNQAIDFNADMYARIRRAEQRVQDVESLMNGKLPQWCLDLGPDNICTYMLPEDKRPKGAESSKPATQPKSGR